MEQWKKLVLYTVLAAYIYTLMEWLFFATKPSFLNGMSFYENMVAIFVSGGMVMLVLLIPMGILFMAYMFLRKHSISKVFFYIALILPTFLLSSLMLVLIDNFTYTVLNIGVVTATGGWRGLYGVFFLYLIWVNLNWAIRFSKSHFQSKLFLYIPLGLAIISTLMAAEQYIQRGAHDVIEVAGAPSKRPHILLIGSDGVNAENMSVYGYERVTTPFFDEISDSLLIAENGFANWNSSAASTTSMLTGKPSLETRVFSAKDILTGINAHQHLPGILRRHGYLTIQMGVLAYVDAYTLNLQEAFDVSNGRRIDQSPAFQLARKLGQGDATYFAIRVFERISDRLMHIYYLREMTNPFGQVTLSGEEVALSDEQKIEQLTHLLTEAKQPVFAHLHLMGTHGPKFSPSKQMFSTGLEQQHEWMPDFYDDSILTFDSYIKKLYERLAEAGSLDNTVIIIYSDHGMAYQTQRLPIIFHFPGGEFAGSIKNNVQNLDIAPTVLDYLEIPVPSWMKGYSLLDDDEPPSHRILITGQTPDTLRIVQCQMLYMFEPNAHIPQTAANIPQDILEQFSYHYNLDINLDEYPLLHFFDYGMMTRADTANLILFYQNTKQDAILPSQGIFADVPQDDSSAPAIEYAYQHGLLGSCQVSPLSFCPRDYVTRQDIAITLLRGLLGNEYTPPPATGIFVDVPVSSLYAPWIEDLYSRNITSGCSRNPLKYCPESPLLTEHLLVFLARTFSVDEQ
jgi:hypothetical protein